MPTIGGNNQPKVSRTQGSSPVRFLAGGGNGRAQSPSRRPLIRSGRTTLSSPPRKRGSRTARSPLASQHLWVPACAQGCPGKMRLRAGSIRNTLKSPCADLIRPSTSSFQAPEGVDAHGSSPWAEGPRDKPGQGKRGEPIPPFLSPRNFPRAALRLRGNDVSTWSHPALTVGQPGQPPSRTTGLLRVPMPVISMSIVSPCLTFSGAPSVPIHTTSPG